jgi:hypothetical protein
MKVFSPFLHNYAVINIEIQYNLDKLILYKLVMLDYIMFLFGPDSKLKFK